MFSLGTGVIEWDFSRNSFKNKNTINNLEHVLSYYHNLLIQFIFPLNDPSAQNRYKQEFTSYQFKPRHFSNYAETRHALFLPDKRKLSQIKLEAEFT